MRARSEPFGSPARARTPRRGHLTERPRPFGHPSEEAGPDGPGLIRVVPTGSPPTSGSSGSRRLQRDRARDLLGVAELPQRLALDQPHALPGKSEDLPGLAQAERTPRVQPI